MLEKNTALGAYLFTKRMERGFENISDYLAKYVPADANAKGVSESYYRALESGRKVIGVKSAEKFCRLFQLDERPFFYFMLRDVLPETAFDQLISPAAVETYSSASERIAQLESRLADSAKVLLEHVSDDVSELSDREIDLLENDDALLAVIHFIFNRDAAEFSEIDEVYRNAGGRGGIAVKLSDIFSNRIMTVDLKAKKAFRRSRTIRVPKTERGVGFKNKFARAEVAKSLAMEQISHLRDGVGTIQSTAIVPIHRDKFDEIERDGIARFISLAQATSETLEDENVSPFFVSVIVSSRPGYDSK